jgi:hypothetical protein
LTRKEEQQQQKENNTSNSYFFGSNNPFVSATTFWQNIMTNWFNAYGEFFKNGAKISEYWYDVYWKPWLNWQQYQRQQQKTDKVKVE